MSMYVVEPLYSTKDLLAQVFLHWRNNNDVTYINIKAVLRPKVPLHRPIAS